MADVFISYATPDRHWAQLLEAKLQAADLSVWVDYASLPGSADWLASVEAGLAGASLVLVVASARATASQFVTYEWAYALGQGRTVRPVVFEPGAAHHPRLARLQHIDVTGSSPAVWQALTVLVAAEVARAAAAVEPSVGDLSAAAFKELIGDAVAEAREGRIDAGAQEVFVFYEDTPGWDGAADLWHSVWPPDTDTCVGGLSCGEPADVAAAEVQSGGDDAPGWFDPGGDIFDFT